MVAASRRAMGAAGVLAEAVLLVALACAGLQTVHAQVYETSGNNFRPYCTHTGASGGAVPPAPMVQVRPNPSGPGKLYIINSWTSLPAGVKLTNGAILARPCQYPPLELCKEDRLLIKGGGPHGIARAIGKMLNSGTWTCPAVLDDQTILDSNVANNPIFDFNAPGFVAPPNNYKEEYVVYTKTNTAYRNGSVSGVPQGQGARRLGNYWFSDPVGTYDRTDDGKLIFFCQVPRSATAPSHCGGVSGGTGSNLMRFTVTVKTCPTSSTAPITINQRMSAICAQCSNLDPVITVPQQVTPQSPQSCDDILSASNTLNWIKDVTVYHQQTPALSNAATTRPVSKLWDATSIPGKHLIYWMLGGNSALYSAKLNYCVYPEIKVCPSDEIVFVLPPAATPSVPHGVSLLMGTDPADNLLLDGTIQCPNTNPYTMTGGTGLLPNSAPVVLPECPVPADGTPCGLDVDVARSHKILVPITVAPPTPGPSQPDAVVAETFNNVGTAAELLAKAYTGPPSTLPPTTGTLKFYCQVGSHCLPGATAMPMQLTITVGNVDRNGSPCLSVGRRLLRK